MSTPSTLDPDASSPSGRLRPPGHDAGSLGPSDRSDTGSDSVGPCGYDPAILADTGDAGGTGVDPSPAERDDGDTGRDIGCDRVTTLGELAAGGGLDEGEGAPGAEAGEAAEASEEPGRARSAAALRAGPGRPRRRGAADDAEGVPQGEGGPDEAMTDDEGEGDGPAAIDEARALDGPDALDDLLPVDEAHDAEGGADDPDAR